MNGLKHYFTRDVFQVIGEDLQTPSDFLICYTEKGKLKGGTAMTLRIAKDVEYTNF